MRYCASFVYQTEKLSMEKVLELLGTATAELVGNLSGLFSRRLNIQHRFVYQVYVGKMVEDNIEYEGTVKIIRMWSHYENLK